MAIQSRARMVTAPTDCLVSTCSYRREVMHSKEPNAAHHAIAQLEGRLEPQGRKVTVITQNIDRLHYRAGSKNIIELHGGWVGWSPLCEEA